MKSARIPCSRLVDDRTPPVADRPSRMRRCRKSAYSRTTASTTNPRRKPCYAVSYRSVVAPVQDDTLHLTDERRNNVRLVQRSFRKVIDAARASRGISVASVGLADRTKVPSVQDLGAVRSRGHRRASPSINRLALRALPCASGLHEVRFRPIAASAPCPRLTTGTRLNMLRCRSRSAYAGPRDQTRSPASRGARRRDAARAPLRAFGRRALGGRAVGGDAGRASRGVSRHLSSALRDAGAGGRAQTRGDHLLPHVSRAIRCSRGRWGPSCAGARSELGLAPHIERDAWRAADRAKAEAFFDEQAEPAGTHSARSCSIKPPGSFALVPLIRARLARGRHRNRHWRHASLLRRVRRGRRGGRHLQRDAADGPAPAPRRSASTTSSSSKADLSSSSRSRMRASTPRSPRWCLHHAQNPAGRPERDGAHPASRAARWWWSIWWRIGTSGCAKSRATSGSASRATSSWPMLGKAGLVGEQFKIVSQVDTGKKGGGHPLKLFVASGIVPAPTTRRDN